MYTLHPTLLIGPADWDEARLPREEFSARIEALWRLAPEADGAIVYGSPSRHAELAWFTHLTPKLEASLALIPRAGAPMLLVGGGVNMLPAARPLTWVDELKPLRDAGKTVAEWALSARRLMLIGGDAMPPALRRAITDGAGSGIAWHNATGDVRRLMRAKSARELGLVKGTCETLGAALAALAASWRGGAGANTAVLAAEHEAIRRGAQDVRTLFSLDAGRTLRPFELLDATHADPFQTYVAVRQAGYWAEGFVTLASGPLAVRDQARAALQAGLAPVRAGLRRGDAARVITDAVGMPHPAAQPPVVSIGLDLDGDVEDDEALVAGEVLSLRAGAHDRNVAAIVSAMLVVQEQGGEILWQSP
jgi:hypothetical protein